MPDQVFYEILRISLYKSFILLDVILMHIFETTIGLSPKAYETTKDMYIQFRKQQFKLKQLIIPACFV